MKRNAATNQFNGGLVMDLNPLLAPNTVLTDCLNGTLITNNGNENVLQNDMGNGRVETAFLPEGYIPVGTCEFGDIIYIASYNPLINKCQVGCFPSPQRNISSETVNNLNQKILNEFQISEGFTGKLKQVSSRKIIYDNNIAAGDKFIIMAPGISSYKYLSDVGNTDHIIGGFPKLWKISVVSIEEDGKITKLDTGLKWYTKNQLDYFLNNEDISNKDENKPDIDSYRSVVSSAYSIFSSKVSGKLGLLIELESITGFSCTWNIANINVGEVEENNLRYTTYDIEHSFNWETDNYNVNPSGIILTDQNLSVEREDENGIKLPQQNTDSNPEYFKISNISLPENYFKGISRIYAPENKVDDKVISYEDFKTNNYYATVEEKYNAINKVLFKSYADSDESNYYINPDRYKDGQICSGEDKATTESLPDDFVNNTLKYPIKKQFYSFKIPTSRILQIEEPEVHDLEVPINLQGLIYNYSIAPYMPYGILEQYAVENSIDFSKIGKKSIKLNTWKYFNQTGYSTLTWGFEAYTEPDHFISRVTFEFYDKYGFAAALHVDGKDSYNGIFQNTLNFAQFGSYGLSFIDHEGNKGQPRKKDPLWNKQDDDSEIEQNKPYIRNNWLYAVKIYVEYAKKGPFDSYSVVSTEKFYRWFWTSKQFNDHYFKIQDFDKQSNILNYNGLIEYNKTNSWKENIGDNSNKVQLSSLTKEAVEESTEKPDSFSYETQNIYGDKNIKMSPKIELDNGYDVFQLNDAFKSEVDVNIIYGNNNVKKYPEPSVQFSDKNLNQYYDGIYVKSAINTNVDDDEITNTYTFNVSDNELKSGTDLHYINDDQVEETKSTYNYHTIKANQELKATFNGTHYSPYYYTTKMTPTLVQKLISFIKDDNDALYYNLIPYGNNYVFNKMVALQFTRPKKAMPKMAAWILNLNYNVALNNSNCISSAQYIKGSYDPANDNDSDSKNDPNFYNAMGNSQNIVGEVATVSKDFLIPYIYAYTWGSSDAGYELADADDRYDFWHGDRTKDNIKVPAFWNGESGVILSANVDFSNFNMTYYYGGLLTSSQGVMNPAMPGMYFYGSGFIKQYGDADIKYAAPIYYGARTYKFLTNCFYVEDNLTPMNYPKIETYVYLEPHYEEFNQDIIIQIPEKNKDIRKYINFNNENFDEYIISCINCVLLNKTDSADQHDLYKSDHVKVIANSYQRTCPLKIRFNYVTPYFDYSELTPVIVEAVDEVKSEAESAVRNQQFNPSKIYCMQGYGDNRRIVELTPGATFNTREFIDATFIDFNVTSSFVDQLKVVNGKLALNNNPSYTTTYNVKLRQGKGAEYLKGLKNFSIFNDVR